MMSIERDLLHRWYRGARDQADFNELYDTTVKLLTQPEPKQEPVAWAMLNRQQVYERGWRAGYEAGGGE